jgi:hypothetical protein
MVRTATRSSLIDLLRPSSKTRRLQSRTDRLRFFVDSKRLGSLALLDLLSLGRLLSQPFIHRPHVLLFVLIQSPASIRRSDRSAQHVRLPSKKIDREVGGKADGIGKARDGRPDERFVFSSSVVRSPSGFDIPRGVDMHDEVRFGRCRAKVAHDGSGMRWKRASDGNRSREEGKAEIKQRCQLADQTEVRSGSGKLREEGLAGINKQEDGRHTTSEPVLVEIRHRDREAHEKRDRRCQLVMAGIRWRGRLGSYQKYPLMELVFGMERQYLKGERGR